MGKKIKLCSACLLGINCRYDGNNKSNDKIISLAKKELLIPICPEQLGGLPTPRIPSEQKGDRVFNKQGKNVTNNFKKGAEEVLKLAKLLNVKEVILKQKSPSCGYGKIYDGTFSNNLIEGNGVTADLLEKNGVKIKTEEDL